MFGDVSFSNITFPRNPNNFICKLCLSSLDDPHHLFYKCRPTKQLISSLDSLLFKTFGKPIILPEHILLYNFTNKTKIPQIIITKLASLNRLLIFQLRNNSYLFPTPISSSLLKEETYKIKTKFKYFLNKFLPDLAQ